MTALIQKYLNQLLSEKLSLPISSLQFLSVGGGSINNTYQVILKPHIKFFLKTNSASRYPALFEKEKNGLEYLGKQKLIRLPSVIACDAVGDQQILLLEWIEGGLRTELFWKKFGEELATLHQVSNSGFGFTEDNYMGALPQLNELHKNWVDFFIICRLKPQIKIATEKSLLRSTHHADFENLFFRLPSIFDQEKPSLLHGDLWSGNFMTDEKSRPVLIDPAIYFGHRSMDLAMTTLFGGFDKMFYQSYNYHFPFPNNYQEQWEICNLYPLLIHLNLFGSGYLGQIENTLRKFT